MPKKSFRLCRREENGTFPMVNQHLILRTTSLYRESYKRIFFRSALKVYDELVIDGMLTWEVYEEHRLAIESSMQSIRHSIQRYKERRLQAGLFHFAHDLGGTRLTTHTHLYKMPLKEALRKHRQENKKEETATECFQQFKEIKHL